MSALEAMSCGLPLITSNVHGINDYSQDDVTGYKSSPNDVFSWAEKIKILIDDPSKREQFGKNNVEIVEKYSMQNILQRMKEIYA